MSGALRYRYDHTGYTPAAALMLLLDPRGGFNGKTLNLPEWYKERYHSLEKDAEQKLRLIISTETQDTQEKIMLQYNNLMMGKCFDVDNPDDVRLLDSANDMPLEQWYNVAARASCRELFLIVCTKLSSIAITADGCEHGNSAYKWVQAGRVSLSDANARMIVFIIINMRMLKLYKALDSAERVKGGYRRCWGWPLEAAMDVELEKEIDAVADPEVAALHANLIAAIADPPAEAAAGTQVGEKRPREEP